MPLQSIFLSPDELIKSDNLFPVVGIGASAGGLEAFRKLISAIPQDSGMAYVLVQHLDPNHESLLPQLLQKMTGLPVIEITDDIRVRPDYIYIIPGNRMLKVVKSQQEHTDELEEKVLKRTQELLESNGDLVKNLSELARKNKELESFNFISSHDLQEPLRKIQMFAGRIIDNEEIALLSEAGKNHFLRIQAAAWRMQTLLEDLLSYSRAGITERTFKKIDLNNVVSEVLDELAENIIELKATVIVGDLCHAEINPSQFRQVLNNILGNGLKYSKKNVPPEISIRSRPVNGSDMTGLRLENAPYCHISITDNGIGFKDIYKEKIFDVFQRLHSKGDYEGTGIGLAIVKKIIENHNGVVNATSEPGVGTTFHIYVPQRHQEIGEMAAV